MNARRASSSSTRDQSAKARRSIGAPAPRLRFASTKDGACSATRTAAQVARRAVASRRTNDAAAIARAHDRAVRPPVRRGLRRRTIQRKTRRARRILAAAARLLGAVGAATMTSNILRARALGSRGWGHVMRTPLPTSTRGCELRRQLICGGAAAARRWISPASGPSCYRKTTPTTRISASTSAFR